MNDCIDQRLSLVSTIEPGHASLTSETCGLFDLGMEHLRAIGSPADALSILHGKAGRADAILTTLYSVTRCFSGQQARPDLSKCVSCGLFDVCVDIVVAFASAGVHGLENTNHSALVLVLCFLAKCGNQPGCEAKIRGIARDLAFCLEHSLTCVEMISATTGVAAARVVCSVFGRDELGSEFTFTPQHIEMMAENWSTYVRAVGWRVNTKPTADSIFAAQLCVSDKNKPLLIANQRFIPYLVDALLLDPDHPRAGMKEELKAWCQEHHCEALAQLSMHEDSRSALLQSTLVIPALEKASETGLTAKTCELATAALVALRGMNLRVAMDGQKHVMLSCELIRTMVLKDTLHSCMQKCYISDSFVVLSVLRARVDQWNVQATIQRTTESLIARGYVTWFDLTNMKGSTMDAMSDAIEGADVMLYGVSLAYKESANVCWQSVLLCGSILRQCH